MTKGTVQAVPRGFEHVPEPINGTLLGKLARAIFLKQKQDFVG